ncbi:hypothetical protein Tco_0576072 [Tanacetum coccineum]
MEDATLFFDKGLRGSIENIVICGGLFFGDLQWRLDSLLIRFGGLGLYSAKVVSSYAFVASRAQSLVLQDHILRDSGICGMDDDNISALACLRDTIQSFDFSGFTNKDIAPSKAQQALTSVLFSEMIKDMKVHFDITMRQKAVFECLRAPHAQDFLLTIPIDGLGQHISSVEYRTILKYRLMISLFLVDAICPICRKACLDSFGEHAVHYKELPGFKYRHDMACLDSFGEHAVHCKELPGFKYRHDMVREILFDICRFVRISTKKEAPVNFLTGPSDRTSTLRPADVLIFGWVGGKHACVDLTRVSPLVRLSSRGFTSGQAALKAVSCKVTKHEKACIENQHVFISFAFDTFGYLSPEVDTCDKFSYKKCPFSTEMLARVLKSMLARVVETSYAANKVKDVAGDTANDVFSLEEYHTAKIAFEASCTLAPDDARFTYRITKCEKCIAVMGKVAGQGAFCNWYAVNLACRDLEGVESTQDLYSTNDPDANVVHTHNVSDTAIMDNIATQHPLLVLMLNLQKFLILLISSFFVLLRKLRSLIECLESLRLLLLGSTTIFDGGLVNHWQYLA